MSHTKVIERLNDAIKMEHTLAMQCFRYEMTVRGLWRLSLAPLFKNLAEEAQGHARKFASKVVALGAQPTCLVADVDDAKSPEDMVRSVLELERGAFAVYTSALAMVPDGDTALRNMLEDHIDAEQQHIDELTLLAADTAEAAKIRRAS